MDQYLVLGPDGTEFGPTDLAGLQQWVREGRVIATSRIRKNGGAAVAAEFLAELAPLFARAETPAAPPIATTIALPDEFRAWAFIGLAWELIKPHWLIFALMSLAFACIGAIPYLGPCVSIVIGGSLMIGYNRALLGVLAGRPPKFEMLFSGFDRFVQAFLAYLVVALIVGLGFVALIVPGIILSIMWMFVSLVLSEHDVDFSDAMTMSANLTKGYRWRLFCLILAAIVVLILGALALCVGVFVAQPVVYMSIALAYRFLQQKNPQQPAAAMAA